MTGIERDCFHALCDLYCRQRYPWAKDNITTGEVLSHLRTHAGWWKRRRYTFMSVEAALCGLNMSYHARQRIGVGCEYVGGEREWFLDTFYARWGMGGINVHPSGDDAPWRARMKEHATWLLREIDAQSCREDGR